MKTAGKRGKREIPVAHPKLEGYKPSTATKDTPGKVEGRARDVEVPLLGKHQGHVASTGRLVDSVDSNMPRAAMPRRRAFEFVALAISNGSEKNKGLAQDLDKALLAEKKASKGSRTSPPSTSLTRQAKTAEEVKKAKEAMAIGLGKAHAAEAFQSVMSDEGVLESLGQLPKKNHSFEISRSEDGAMQFHCTAPSADPKYPGEKELSIDVIPVPAKNVVMEPHMGKAGQRALDYVSWDMGSTNSTILVSSSFPTDAHGKPHPYTRDFDGKYEPNRLGSATSMGFIAAMASSTGSIIKDFFNDNTESKRAEEEADAENLKKNYKPSAQEAARQKFSQNPNYHRQGGGEIWQPKKA